MSEQDSTRTTQNVVIRFVKNWIGVWYGVARALGPTVRHGAILIAVTVGGTLYLCLPTLAYTVHRHGWEALYTPGEYKIDAVFALLLTVVWVAVTVSIAVAASRTWEGDSRE